MTEKNETRYLSDPKLRREFRSVEEARAYAPVSALADPGARTRVRLRPNGTFSVLTKVPTQVSIVSSKENP